MVVDDILQNKEAHMAFITVFLGLKKEWCQVLPHICSLLGKVIALKDKASLEDDRIRGAPVVRILVPRNNVLNHLQFCCQICKKIRRCCPRGLCVRGFRINVSYVDILGF